MSAVRSPHDTLPLLDGYAGGGVFDEMMGEGGVVRTHWRPFMDRLSAIGTGELGRRWDAAQQIIHENGVSFNVYGDAEGLSRPWNLSPVPVLISPPEWAALERGIAQRARLLDAVLADLYGPQRCLAEGLLPPDLVFGRPSFLRACHGMTVPQRRWLVFYAADLMRGQDGRFCVFADRTQAPSGAGYALENRIVISRTLPEAFAECNVRRLALFFRRVQETLAALAPHNRDNPRVVLLTPGPYNSTYFEQAYMAQYLGYTLVTGGDLTVRDGRVYLKTLGGLQQVDVVLRRVNDDWCDPLELRPDTLLGVAGLVEACRSGNVAVANPLGSGLVRTPALLPFLPGLCGRFLGEPLALDSVRSWWCGDPSALGEVVSRFDQMVLRPTFSENYVHPVFVATLSAAEKEEALGRLRDRPRDWVAQERFVPSTTPVLGADRLGPRSLVLRTFAVAKRDGFEVMPGALARVAGASSGYEVSMQLGAGSKDTWVLSDEPVSAFSLLPPASQRIALSRGGGDLPSRVADNLYWLGRYAERAEAVARTARVLLLRLGDSAFDPASPHAEELAPLSAALAAQTEIALPDPGASWPRSFRVYEESLAQAILDPRTPGSLAASVRSTLQVARMVRDRLSQDTWKVLASLEGALDLEREHNLARNPAELASRLGHLILELAAFSGLAGESMTRGQAWRFLDLGRRLERALNMLALLKATLGHRCDREGPLLDAVLQIADSAMTYRRRYLAALQVPPVLDLLLTDETNPRSVVYQVVALEEHLGVLPAAPSLGVRSPQEKIVMSMLAALRMAPVEELCTLEDDGSRPALVAFLTETTRGFPALSDCLTERYLSHTTLPRNLAQGGQLP